MKLNSLRIISIFIMLALTVYLSGQDFSKRIYNAYISAEMTIWLEAMDEMEIVWEVTGSYSILQELANARYGYIGFCLIKDDRQTARKILEKAEKDVKLLLEQYDTKGEFYALSGALYGMKVGIDPIKTVFYGRRAFTLNAKALELGPNEARVWLEKGNLDLHKPVIFGRDIPEAIEDYKRAILLYERSGNDRDNWLYMASLVSLAEAYIKNGEYLNADLTYRTILEKEPNITWIRDRDYPRFQKLARENGIVLR